MNFAFVVVVLAAVSGVASELALRSVAPETGPALALCVMSIALFGTAWRQGKTKAAAPAPAASPKQRSDAGESLAPV